MNVATTATTSSPAPSSTLPISHDPHAQLRALYIALLENQAYFDEFKHLLSLYAPPADQMEEEPAECARVRSVLNNTIRGWVTGPFTDLSVAQVLQWRAIVVDERLNVSISPWKESNVY
ncbi:MAG: hypothetical protein R3F14_34145 [Polyangiaceae bacterium]